MMTITGTTTIAEGSEALVRLLKDIAESELDWNEAETRFQIIDRIIVECLGWPRESLRLEQGQENRAYCDYELGEPRCAIWEAKRQNRTFELPADPQGRIVKDLPSIMALDDKVSTAIQQVQEYCSTRGVELAVATNGHQLIAFLATRSDGTAPLKGRCLVINGYEHLKEEFPTVWQMLSPAGVAEHRLNWRLNIGENRALPQKMSSLLANYPKHRYPSELQSTLRDLGELLLIDVVDQSDIEREFYKQCYCESGALSQHALVSKRMLAARYASLFDQKNKAPNVEPVRTRAGKPAVTPELLRTEAISQRPIVLIGDVGVGKTSFLKHLMYISAFEEFQNATSIYIDLGSQGALSVNLTDFVLAEIETQLYDRYEIDVHEDGFVRGVYHSDILRFQRSIYNRLRDQDPPAYEQKLRESLEEKMTHRDRHLKNSISHIVRGQRKQVIIILDNADQRDYEVQQAAFIVAQTLAKDWEVAVFIAVRPQTFYKSKQAGSLTAYLHRVFTISPPRVDRVIERRLEFALGMAEGRVPIERLQGINFRLGNIVTFLKALRYSLSRNTELVEFLSNITAGNIRAVIDFVTKFIGSANVNAQKIIDIMEDTGRYVIPLHEFWKAALLGEYSYYDPQSSLAFNLFDIINPNQNEHFLVPMILGYLDSAEDHKSKDGFVASKSIITEMQEWAFTPEATESALRRANNKKLLETNRRVTFDEDEGGLFGDMPEYFRISTIGAYHFLRWITDFSYIDAMSYDTPILDRELRDALSPEIASFAITDRLDRALTFRKYLSKAWHSSKLAPSYFDWASLLATGEESFERVQNAIKKNGGR